VDRNIDWDEKPVLLICTDHAEPREFLEIKKLKLIGQGAQAEVFKCKITGMKGRFVDKYRKVFNNR